MARVIQATDGTLVVASLRKVCARGVIDRSSRQAKHPIHAPSCIFLLSIAGNLCIGRIAATRGEFKISKLQGNPRRLRGAEAVFEAEKKVFGFPTADAPA